MVGVGGKPNLVISDELINSHSVKYSIVISLAPCQRGNRIFSHLAITCYTHRLSYRAEAERAVNEYNTADSKKPL